MRVFPADSKKSLGMRQLLTNSGAFPASTGQWKAGYGTMAVETVRGQNSATSGGFTGLNGVMPEAVVQVMKPQKGSAFSNKAPSFLGVEMSQL